MKKEYYKAYNERYIEVHKEGLLWLDDGFTEDLYDFIDDYRITKEDSILEIGCGEGRDSKVLLEQGYNLVASDVSEEALITLNKLTNNKFKDSIVLIDAVKDKPNKKYSFIYSICTLHMLVLQEHRNAFYQYIFNSLEDNGKVLIIIQGDGTKSYKSDIETAFNKQKRKHQKSGQEIEITSTSYCMKTDEELLNEILLNGFNIIEKNITEKVPGYSACIKLVLFKNM